jgi:hypothetical protein
MAQKENNCQPKLLWPTKQSFIIEREIKTFHDEQKLMEFMVLLSQNCKKYLKEYGTQKRKSNTTMKT